LVSGAPIITDISEVNGREITSGLSGQIANQTGQFAHFTNFVLNSSNTDFIPGINTIEFVVTNNSNGSPDVTGVNIDIQKFDGIRAETGIVRADGLRHVCPFLGAKKWKRR
jgi:hypothetical protein